MSILDEDIFPTPKAQALEVTPRLGDQRVAESEARLIYLGLGGQRSLENVRRQLATNGRLAPHLTTLKEWSSYHGWVRLAEEHDARVTARASTKLVAAQADVLARAGVSAMEIIEEVRRVGFASLYDLMSDPDNQGNRTIELSKLTPALASAISECAVETYVEGRGDDAREVKRVRIKLNGQKLEALKTLASWCQELRVAKEGEQTNRDSDPSTTVNVFGDVVQNNQRNSVSAEQIRREVDEIFSRRSPATTSSLTLSPPLKSVESGNSGTSARDSSDGLTTQAPMLTD